MDQSPKSHETNDFPITDIQLSVSPVTHPDGRPADWLDLDVGIVIRGKVTLPNQLTGTGHINVYAQEIGGPIYQSIGSDAITYNHSTAEPGTTDHMWSIVIPPGPEIFSDFNPELSHVFNVIVVFVHDQDTEIAKYLDIGRYLIN